jgi:endonuclease-3
VDTHIWRIAKRLGWISPRDSAEKAHEILGAAIPAEHYYRVHIHLIRFGREICVARMPRCEICPLTDLCAYYARHLKR